MLYGRREPDEEAQKVLKTLQEAGVEVQVMLATSPVRRRRWAGDPATDRGFVAPLVWSHPLGRRVARRRPVEPELAAVHRSAGSQSAGGLAPASVDGRTRPGPVRLVLSSDSLLGSRGQSNHAAANMFLDQLARARRARGLARRGNQLGSLVADRGGRSSERTTCRSSGEGGGWDGFRPSRAWRPWSGPHGDAAQVGVVPVDWRVFERQFAGGRCPACSRKSSRPPHRPASPPKELLGAGPACPQPAGEGRLPLLVEYSEEEVSRLLRLDARRSRNRFRRTGHGLPDDHRTTQSARSGSKPGNTTHSHCII